MSRTINNTLMPMHPEHGATHLSEGYMIGLIPGIIESIDDPEGIGRVRVSAPLIHEGSYLPNDRDGWIPVCETWVNNGTPGGSHRFLQPGTQVILAPIMGDPRQMVVMGCLPSRVDRPHPSLNRANGTYGDYTPGQVLKVSNDTDSSRLETRPNGVTEHISGEGSVTVQTMEKARLQLTFDGDSLLDNPDAFTLVSKDGTVAQQSKDGAQAVLRTNGVVDITSANQARLLLNESLGQLVGPAGSISGLLRSAKDKLSGLSDLGSLFKQLQGLMNQFPTGEELLKVVDDISSRIESAVSGIAEGVVSLESIAMTEADSMGKTLMPQVDEFLKIDSLIQDATGWLEERLDIKTLASRLQAQGLQLAENQLTTLEGLIYAPDHALQYIVDLAAPEFDAVANIFGMNLQGVLGDIRSEFADIIRQRDIYLRALETYRRDDDGPEQPTPPDYQGVTYRIYNALPTDIRAFIQPNDIEATIQDVADVDGAMQRLMGLSSAGLTATGVEKVAPLVEAAEILTEASQAMTQITHDEGEAGLLRLKRLLPNGAAIIEETEAVETLVTEVFQNITRDVGPLLGTAVEDLNKLFNSIPENLAGAFIQASTAEAKMTGPGGTGGVVRAVSSIAEMTGPGGGGIVQAGSTAATLMGLGSQITAGAGFISGSSPLGGFSFGGGFRNGFFGRGVMNMLASAKDGLSQGVRYDENRVDIGRFREEDDEPQWETGIHVTDQEILLRIGNNHIRIDQQDIYLNGTSLTDILTLFVIE